MSLAKTRLVLAATVIAESAWLYIALGVMGVSLSERGSPLIWPAVLAIMASSLLVSRALQSITLHSIVGYAIQAACGIVVILLTVGSQVAGVGLDLGWVKGSPSPSELDGFVFREMIGGIAAVGLWWRGGRLASSEEPTETLFTSFKTGMAVIAIGAVVDAMHASDLKIYPMMFLFIAFALGGLATGHLLPGASQANRHGAWPRVIGGVVSGLVVFGLLLVVVLNSFIPFVSRLVRAPYLLLVDTVAEPLAALIARPFFFIVTWFFSHFTPPETRVNPLDQSLEELRRFAEENDPGVVANIILWFIIAAVLLIALLLLAKAFRKRAKGRLVYAEGQRESVREDADPLLDLASLLLRLLPERFRRRRRWRTYRLPDGDTRIAETLLVYYRLLMLAERVGLTRRPSETPSEFQRKLESAFPPVLVRMATNAFNRALYGDQPCPEAQLGEMRASIGQLRPATA